MNDSGTSGGRGDGPGIKVGIGTVTGLGVELGPGVEIGPDVELGPGVAAPFDGSVGKIAGDSLGVGEGCTHGGVMTSMAG